jgi:hypothetical protein
MTPHLLLVVGIKQVLEGQAALYEISLERIPDSDDLRIGGDGAQNQWPGARC